jgi:hypothetical protein
MFQNASFNIVGMADIECVVCAPKNVDKRHDVTTMPSSMDGGNREICGDVSRMVPFDSLRSLRAFSVEGLP